MDPELRERNGARAAMTADSAAGTEERLVQAMDEYRAAADAGRPLERAALLARYPEIAEELAACLDSLEFIHEIAPQLGEGGRESRGRGGREGQGGAGEINAAAALGDFRILRQIGRGGMGVVYEAEQLSLGRRVALKVLPFAAMLDEKQLKRFQNEARAAATLEHPNIVSVHSVGTDRGVHYYAMQLIEGQSMAEVIDELRRANADAEPALAASASEQVRGEGVKGPRGRGAKGDEREGEAPAEPRGEGGRDGGQGDKERGGRGDEAASWLDPTIESGKPSPPYQEGARGGEQAGHPEPADDGFGVGADAALADTARAVQTALSTSGSNRTPEFFRSVARLGIQAAEALDHAHQQGVVHRDVKPANLMLDARGNLSVTDFGLAQIESDAGMTMTGDLIGTMRYMSPEQALAKRVVIDHRTDVYSLGVTLYELVALRPAYDGNDRQELLKQIAFDEPKPPRRFNGRIPEELETIVLKAMAKEPEERYATAQDLSDDLRRWTLHEPIKAKRPSLARTVMKWTRRNRSVVATAVSITLTCLVLSTALMWLGKRQTEKALLRAKANLVVARSAVDDMYTQVAEKWLANEPGMTPLQREFLEKALAYYEQLAETNVSDELRYERGLAYQRVGYINNQLENFGESENACRAAIAIFEQLAYESPDCGRYWNHLGHSLVHLGYALGDTGRHHECEAAHRRATEIYTELVEAFPHEPRYREWLACRLNDLGNDVRVLDRLEEAEGFYRESLAISEQLLEEDPANSSYQETVGFVLSDFGGLLSRDDPASAELFLRRAMEISDQLAGLFPERNQYQHQLASRCSLLGNALISLDREAEAEHLHQRALAIRERLFAQFPKVLDYQASLARDYAFRGNRLIRDGRLEEAEAFHAEALRLRRDWVHRVPNRPSAKHELAQSCHDYARILRLTGRTQHAANTHFEGLRINQQVATDHPELPRSWRALAKSQQRVARFMVLSTDCQDTDRAVDLSSRAIKLDPENRGAW